MYILWLKLVTCDQVRTQSWFQTNAIFHVIKGRQPADGHFERCNRRTTSMLQQMTPINSKIKQQTFALTVKS